MNNTQTMCDKHIIDKYLSYSAVKLFQQCPFAWRVRYIDGVRTEPSKAMLMGSMFDMLCEVAPDKLPVGYTDIVNTLDLSDSAIVLERYYSYKSYIDYDNDSMQVFVHRAIPDTDYHMLGWVDRVRQDDKGIILVDNKFSQKPWKRSKVQAYALQAQMYLSCYPAGTRFEFHVCNAQTDEVQIFEYKPTAKTMLGLDKKLADVVESITRNWLEPTPNRLCNWCDYSEICDKYRTRQLTKELDNETT